MNLKLSTITTLVNYGAAVVLVWQYHKQLHEGLDIQVIAYYIMQIELRYMGMHKLKRCISL